MARETRRLAAIVAADVVGFSRLVGLDEEGTLRSLRSHRKELTDPLIVEHRGRIANTAGDSLLVEFPSVVEAVRCMTAVQEGMADRNSDLPADQQIVFRVGIHVGDVVENGEDLLGDGVNIAARLETLCAPGAITISEDAHRQVRDRLDAHWSEGGDHEVKNIARPIRVWQWNPAEGVLKPTHPAVPVKKPSIAVLPFDNMSGDAGQEYFSDGIAEDLITSLSKLRWLFVIARNSTFVYKGESVSVQDVGSALGVRYVLEGSVRRAADRVRITAQLVEADSGNHLWAERYDRDMTDVFAVQDDITTRIVAALDPAIRNFETHAALRKPPASLQAWDHLLRGLWQVSRYHKDSNLEARAEFEKAVELDPHYARALAWLASTYVYDVMFDWTDDKETALKTADGLAIEARRLDGQDPFSHTVVAAECFWSRRFERGRHAIERALELDPNSFEGHYIHGGFLNYLGEVEASIEASETALQLSPHDPIAWHCLGSLAHANYNLRAYERAVDAADRAIAIRPGYLFARIVKTASLGQLDKTEAAARSLEGLKGRSSSFSTSVFDYYPFAIEEQRQHLIDGIIKAGEPAATPQH